MWHSLIAFIDNKTLFLIGIGLCRISFPMRLLLPFERGRPLLQLSSDDSSPAVDSDLSQPKKIKEKSNESEYNQSIAFDDSLTASSTQASISCSRHRRLPAPVHERWMKVSLTTNSRMLGTISFGESLPSRGPLPPFFWIWERGKREVQRDLDSFRERREIECEMESLPNGMDILGDSCVRLNLP